MQKKFNTLKKNYLKAKKIKSNLVLIFCLLACGVSMAQYSLSSPYSRYGIGTTDVPCNQVMSAMGGIGQAFHRNNVVNTFNPASYTAIDTQSFVFDIGFQMGWRTISTSQYSSNSFLAELTNISFGFPITRYLKAGLSLSPLSNISYNSSDTIAEQATMPLYVKTFDGNGELDKLTFGLAYQPLFSDFLKRFSIGANVSYTFGNIYRSTTVAFPDTTGFLNDRSEINYNVSAFSFDFGLQYFQPFENGNILGFGLTYTLPMNYGTDNTMFYYTFYDYGNQDVVQDTILYRNYDGDIKMPQRISGGLSFEKPNKLFLAADITYTTWSDFEFQEEGKTDAMKNNLKINFGSEFVPDLYGNFVEKFTYRLGFNYDNGYIYLKDNRIAKIGLTFGFSMPIKKLGTNINFNFEYGKMGTHDNGLVRENYFKMGLSVTAKDRWFAKRKYK